MTRAPSIPDLPDQLAEILPNKLADITGRSFESAEAWKRWPSAVLINQHAKDLLRYGIELQNYQRNEAAAREARGSATDKGTARQRELQRLYWSTGLRERIWNLLDGLAHHNAPPTPHLLTLIALLDAPAGRQVYNAFKALDDIWEPTNWKWYSAAQYIAQSDTSGSKPVAAEIAREFNVHARTIRRWLRDPKFRERAGLAPLGLESD
jgi:hypothetical protein